MSTKRIERLIEREKLKEKARKAKKKKKMDKLNDPTLFRNRFEFSKFITILVILIFTSITVWSMFRYYDLVELAISSGATILPDATLPVAAITTIIGSVLTYLAYQGTLKMSLNRNNLCKDYRTGAIKAMVTREISEVINNAIDKEAEKVSETDRSSALAGEPVLEDKDDVLF